MLLVLIFYGDNRKISFEEGETLSASRKQGITKRNLEFSSQNKKHN
jgi:hypothetical protein